MVTHIIDKVIKVIIGVLHMPPRTFAPSPTSPYENWHVQTIAPKGIAWVDICPLIIFTKVSLKTVILAKVAFIKTHFYLVVAARGLILPQETSEFVGGNLE